MAKTIETVKGSNKAVGNRLAGTIGIFAFLLILGIFVFLTLLGLFMLFPIYLMVIMSVKPVHELFIFPPKLYAIDPTLDNYRDMFETLSDMWVPFSRYLFNSVFVTVCVTVAQSLVGFPSTDYKAHTIMTHAYDYGWVRYEMGYASAICMVLFIAMLVCNKLISKLLSNFMD